MSIPAELKAIDFLLRSAAQAPQDIQTFSLWKKSWARTTSDWLDSIDRAVIGGFVADRPAWAFAAGYQSAIGKLMAPEKISGVAAICITEEGGGHPAKINTRLVRDSDDPNSYRLSGNKSFVTGGADSDILLVAASTGKSDDGRNILRMVKVETDREGVTIQEMPPLGLVPEISHAAVSFEAVKIPETAVIEGDGYINTVKPFRTFEDLHVMTAFLGYSFGLASRNNWPPEIAETIIALLLGARALAPLPPLDPALHIALGGFIGQVQLLLKKIEPLIKKTGGQPEKIWQRDSKILQVAATARTKRLEAAWKKYQ